MNPPTLLNTVKQHFYCVYDKFMQICRNARLLIIFCDFYLCSSTIQIYVIQIYATGACLAKFAKINLTHKFVALRQQKNYQYDHRCIQNEFSCLSIFQAIIVNCQSSSDSYYEYLLCGIGLVLSLQLQYISCSGSDFCAGCQLILTMI